MTLPTYKPPQSKGHWSLAAQLLPKSCVAVCAPDQFVNEQPCCHDSYVAYGAEKQTASCIAPSALCPRGLRSTWRTHDFASLLDTEGRTMVEENVTKISRLAKRAECKAYDTLCESLMHDFENFRNLNSKAGRFWSSIDTSTMRLFERHSIIIKKLSWNDLSLKSWRFVQ